MASGYFNTTTGKNLNLYLFWSSTSDVPTRSASITVYARLYFTSLDTIARNSQPITIDGTTYYYNAPAISDYTGSLHYVEIGSANKTVYYGSATDKQVDISGSWVFNGTFSGLYINTLGISGTNNYPLNGTTITLDTIPPANTAPYWTSQTLAPATQYIPESQTSITPTISAHASDAESNPLTYYIDCSINGGAWSNVYTGSSLSFSHSIASGSGSQGYTYAYRAIAYDGALYSGYIYSGTVTKNTLTAATLASSTSIAFATTTIAFTWSGASNTNGNSSFTYRISNSGLTIVNPNNNITSPFNMKIWRTGDAVPPSTEPYVRFDDIKTKFASSSYNGSLVFTLTTTNTYSTTGTSNKTIPVDLRVFPSSFTINTPTGTVTINSNPYYIPGRQAIGLSWSASTDGLGTSIAYEVWASYNSGAYSLLQSNISSTSTTITITGLTSQTACKFKVYARSAYGYTTASEMGADIQLHYYNPPTIAIIGLVRTQDTVTVDATITGNSSINDAKTLYSLQYQGIAGAPPTSITLDTTPTVVEDSGDGVGPASTYTFYYYTQDVGGNVLGTAIQSASTLITTYIPMFSVRKKGVGVNALADDTYVFKVGGSVALEATTPRLSLISTDGSTADVIFDRGATKANWKFLASGGNMYFQCDWDGAAKVAYYNVLQLNNNTGNAIIKGNINSTGLSTTWGTTSTTSTGALNAVMGTSSAATWLLSGTSGGTFRYGIQGLDAGGTLRIYEGTNYINFNGGTLSASTIACYGPTYAGYFGPTAWGWGGSSAYPTLYSSHADRWIMLSNPHIPYLQNGVDGFTGTTAGARITFASYTSATTSWNMGIGCNGNGTDVFSIGRQGTSFLNINNSGNLTLNYPLYMAWPNNIWVRHIDGASASDLYLNYNATGTIYNYGNVYATANVSADSFTDRTKGYSGDALVELALVENDENGNINHSTLPKAAQKKIKVKKEVKDVDGKVVKEIKINKGKEYEVPKQIEVEEDGRDLGAMISILTVAVQQLTKRIEEQAEEIRKLKTKTS